MDKQTLRKKYFKIRNNILGKAIKSNIIFNKIINTKEYQQAKTIALYKSLNTEVNTDELIDYSLTIGKEVVLPKVENDEIVFYKINKDSKLIKSNLGILEPIANQNDYFSKEQINLIIVPGVCFDKQKNRLGFGKGYYDRFLMNIKIIKIGICFNEQLIDYLPTDIFDVKMDLIITDKEII